MIKKLSCLSEENSVCAFSILEARRRGVGIQSIFICRFRPMVKVVILFGGGLEWVRELNKGKKNPVSSEMPKEDAP